MKAEPLKDKIVDVDSGEWFKSNQIGTTIVKAVLVEEIKSAVEWLKQALKGQCEFEDVENKKYIHNDETIHRIVNRAFEDVISAKDK